MSFLRFTPSRRRSFGSIIIVSLLLTRFLRAGEAPASSADVSKSRYDLFHPVPASELRSFSSDRPSQSTGPFTVDAGHFYFETDVLNYITDRSGGVRFEQFSVLPFNLRIGLTNRVELDLSYGSFVYQRTHDNHTGQTETRSGSGDFVVQSKINLFGNDGGSVALALLPSIKLPANTNDLGNDSVEGGISLPFSVNLPADFSLGLQSGVNFVRNASDSGYRPAYVNAIALGHSILPKLSGYVEFYTAVVSGAGESYSGQVDTGLVYQIAPNAEIDFGCNFGVTRAAPDFQPFTGFSFRY